MKKSTGTILLTVLVFTLLVISTAQARNYVLPTWYGYGSAEKHSGVVRPYIVPGTAYQYPHYYSAYAPTYNPNYTPTYYSNYGGYAPYYPYYNSGYPYYTAAMYSSSMYAPYYSFPYASWWGTNFPYGATLGVVNTNHLNVRSGPSKGKNIIGGLRTGEQVWIYGRNGNWFYVRSVSRPELVGYSYGDYFNLSYHYPYSYNYPQTYYHPR